MRRVHRVKTAPFLSRRTAGRALYQPWEGVASRTGGDELMDKLTRMSVERRAYELWQAAGRPEGTGLAHWLQAELELGVIPAVEPSDPFKTLPEFARAIADETIRSAAHKPTRPSSRTSRAAHLGLGPSRPPSAVAVHFVAEAGLGKNRLHDGETCHEPASEPGNHSDSQVQSAATACFLVIQTNCRAHPSAALCRQRNLGPHNVFSS